VRELEPIQGIRVVAAPAALDGASWTAGDGTLVCRFAPDEAFGWRQGEPLASVRVDDPDAIIETERGFSAAYLTPDDVAELRQRAEFAWPDRRPALVQGKIAGVPVKVWLADLATGDCLLVATAYVVELAERLGWSRIQ
jgi:hypothetical protein